VFARASAGLTEMSPTPHLHLYPTNSRHPFLYVSDAYKIACRVIKGLDERPSLTTQDPFETGLVGMLLKKKFDITQFETQLHTDPFSEYYPRAHPLNRVRRVIASFVLRQATHIRVVSERVKKSLIKRGFPVAIEVRPIRTDEERIRHAKDSFSFPDEYARFSRSIITVGRLEREKNLFLAIDAVAALQEKSPHGNEIAYTMIGSGSLAAELKKYAEKKLAPGTFFMRGALAPEDVWTYMRYSIVLHTSLIEGYGLVLKEAALNGARIVTSDVGIAPELLGEYGPSRVYIYEQGSVEDCCEGLIKMCL
jgi:glycosyltransferase involved in cell wall biosynthesis